MEQESVSILIQKNAEESVINVEEGNKELQKAKEYQGGNGKIFAGIFIAYSVVLWIWEYMNTRYY
jgi:hypothetical protein